MSEQNDQLRIVQVMCLDKTVWQLSHPMPNMPQTKISDIIVVNDVVEVIAQDNEDMTKMVRRSIFPPIATTIVSAGARSAWDTALRLTVDEFYEDLDEVIMIDGAAWRVGAPVPGDSATRVVRIVRALGAQVIEIFVLPLPGSELEKVNIALHFTVMPLTVASATGRPSIARGTEIMKLLKDIRDEEDEDEEDEDEEDEDDLDEQVEAATTPSAIPGGTAVAPNGSVHTPTPSSPTSTTENQS